MTLTAQRADLMAHRVNKVWRPKGPMFICCRPHPCRFVCRIANCQPRVCGFGRKYIWFLNMARGFLLSDNKKLNVYKLEVKREVVDLALGIQTDFRGRDGTWCEIFQKLDISVGRNLYI